MHLAVVVLVLLAPAIPVPGAFPRRHLRRKSTPARQSPNSAGTSSSPTFGTRAGQCIRIRASDVGLSGRDHRIGGTGAFGTAGVTVGAWGRSVSNVTVRNLVAENRVGDNRRDFLIARGSENNSVPS